MKRSNTFRGTLGSVEALLKLGKVEMGDIYCVHKPVMVDDKVYAPANTLWIAREKGAKTLEQWKIVGAQKKG